jgi:ABC-type multidrug transport system fused ATPase/permease subunit
VLVFCVKFNFELVALSICSSELNLTIASLNAASEIHRGLLSNIFRQPMSFFELIPIGRVLSRFSRDLGGLDEELPFSCYEVIESSCIVSVSAMSFLFSSYI